MNSKILSALSFDPGVLIIALFSFSGLTLGAAVVADMIASALIIRNSTRILGQIIYPFFGGYMKYIADKEITIMDFLLEKNVKRNDIKNFKINGRVCT